jgi:hypothetical protein
MPQHKLQMCYPGHRCPLHRQQLQEIPTLFTSIATYQRPARRFETVLDRLIKLDSLACPGLSQAEFNRLLVKCHCGLLMTRRVFSNHVCAALEVIDLTVDEDDSNGRIIIDLTTDSEEESQ